MTLDISVLLPTYNRGHFIGEAIQSALDQTYPPSEIIVLDDGSTDNTVDVAGSFGDPRVRYIRQDNKGIGAAFNAAFQASHCPLVAILGSDDVWLPNLLQEEAPVLESDRKVGLVSARAQAMDAAGRSLWHMLGAPEKYPGDTFRSLLYGDHICGITVVMRRECVERAGRWDEDIVANEDWDIWLRLALVCRFHFVDKVLARFRVHGENLSGPRSQHFAQLAIDRVRVLDKVFARPDLPSSAASMRRLAYQNVYTDVGLRWLSAGDRPQALRFLGKAVRNAPSPYTAPFRILYLIMFYQFLNRRRWGVRLVNTLVDWRRKYGR